MKTVRCSFNNIHQNRKNLPRNKDDAYAHEVTERSAVPERSEVVWFSSNEVRLKGVRARPVGGAGAHAPETSSPRAKRGRPVFYRAARGRMVFPPCMVLSCFSQPQAGCPVFPSFLTLSIFPPPSVQKFPHAIMKGN